MGKRILVVVALLVLLGLLTAGALWWRAQPDNGFQEAVSRAPADAQRLTYTDWAGVRRQLGADLSADSSADELSGFMSDAFETDLSSMSALPESAETLHDEFGFSPATLEWELLSQSEAGAAVLMKLPEGTDFDALADRLEELGYRRPADDTGVWVGGVDLLPSIGTLTPELQYLALDADAGLVVGSDTERYLEQAMPAATGEEDGVEGLDEVVEASGDPLAAAVYDGPVACSVLAMGHAGPADQDEAEQLVEAAGEVNPMTGFAMSAQPGGDVRVVMAFESEEQARQNADSRAALASGPAPGQGGDFADRFRLGTVSADSELVTMALHPREGSYVLSDLSSGPVLFATC